MMRVAFIVLVAASAVIEINALECYMCQAVNLPGYGWQKSPDCATRRCPNNENACITLSGTVTSPSFNNVPADMVMTNCMDVGMCKMLQDPNMLAMMQSQSSSSSGKLENVRVNCCPSNNCNKN